MGEFKLGKIDKIEWRKFKFFQFSNFFTTYIFFHVDLQSD